MSQLQTQPVLLCRRCGRPVRLSLLRTFGNDPDGTILHQLFKAAQENALCQEHQMQRAYYQQQGRLDDWERGNL